MSLDQNQLRLVQMRSLRIYREFERYCEHHHLTIYVCGGGLIGAMRNHAFIPWDDDIDVFMPRCDYDRLRNQWQSGMVQGDLQLISPDAVEFQGEQLSKLYDLSAPCICKNESGEISSYLSMDIVPLDGFPACRAARISQLFWASVYGLCAVGRPPEKHGKIVRSIAKLLLYCLKKPKYRNHLLHYAEQRMSRFCRENCIGWTELCSGWKYINNCYPYSVFGNPRTLLFEDASLLTPSEPETYLKIAFGDYMQLPPPEQRVPSHNICSIHFL